MKAKWSVLPALVILFFSPLLAVAGCCPFIVSVYTAAFMNRINRGLLFLAACFGMVVFLSVNDMVKYMAAVTVISILLLLLEHMKINLPSAVSALLASVILMVLIFTQQFFLISEPAFSWQGVLEGVFVFGAAVIFGKIIFFIQNPSFKRQSRALRRQTLALQTEQEAKAHVCAESVQELAKVFEQPTKEEEAEFEEEQLLRLSGEMTGRVCLSCSQCALCWEEKESSPENLFHALLQSIAEKGTVDEKKAAELDHQCIIADKVVEEALHVMECAALNRAWHQRLLEHRNLISMQLDSVADMIEQKFTGEKDISSEYRSILKEISYALLQKGVLVHEISLKKKRDFHLKMNLRAQMKNGRSLGSREMAGTISKILGHEMISHRDNRVSISTAEAEFLFEEAPVFKELHGMAKIVKDEAEISGDNFSFCSFEEGEMNLCLSDGMGSGRDACKESEMVLELIERFLEAGFNQELAVRMMSSSMMLQSSREQFSTIDIASINLYNGNCSLYKIGAAATFIRRKDGVECIISNSLPVGILQQMDLEIHNTVLEDGDFIVLVSDGVLDHLDTGQPEETMKEIIEKIETNHPTKFAKEVLKHVMLYTGGKAKDDMTVLAVGVWER